MLLQKDEVFPRKRITNDFAVTQPKIQFIVFDKEKDKYNDEKMKILL